MSTHEIVPICSNSERKQNEKFLNVFKYFSSFTAQNKHEYQTIRERRIKQEELGKMPDTTVFASCHVMINKARVYNNIPMLTRCDVLDKIAIYHANYMLLQTKVIPILDESVLSLFQQYALSQLKLNVSRGSSIRESQKKFMRSKNPKQNILNNDFKKMGFGTAKDARGRLYICQIFARTA